MEFSRLSPTADGGTCFGKIKILVDDTVTDSSGNTVSRSSVLPAISTMLWELPESFDQDWHASRRQFVIVMSGSIVVETTDGAQQVFRAGEMLVSGDLGTRGHRTRTLDGPARLLFVDLPADLDF